ncbi:MAG: thiol peroxidase [Sedimentisphaerales bacterium]|nr:thiol peroxidase [Sedimentisphaerales bacterium]
MQERRAAITFKGRPMTLVGREVSIGQIGPDAVLVADDLSDRALSAYKGKVVIISAVPSLDTPVCDLQTRTFNQKVQGLGSDVIVLTISMDLPFAQRRWCGSSGLPGVLTLSDHRDAAFGLAYGVLIKELRLLARSVFVLDKPGIIRYIQIVPEVTDQPDYAAALKVASGLAGKGSG